MSTLSLSEYVPEANLLQAPEVYEGHYSDKVDVFSFGILFWEAMTSQSPLSGTPLDKVPQAIESGVRPSLDALDAAFRPLVAKCWGKGVYLSTNLFQF